MSQQYLCSKKNQKGASLIFTLFAILILLSASAISIKNVLTQQENSGNLALRQELIQQAEWVIATIIENEDELPSTSGEGTGSETADISKNYSPHLTDVNSQGIPLALLVSDTAFATNYGTKNYAGPSNSSVKFRHFIERMCPVGEPKESKYPTGCLTTASTPASGSDNQRVTLDMPPNVIYRISLRVDGPKNTQVFIQSTFTRE